MRNMDGIFNKERSIKNMMEVDIYYQGHRKRTEIDIIEEQRWNIYLSQP